MQKIGPRAHRFSPEIIQSLFGHEAAEDEKPERLREYYFKGQAFDAITADLPLRILVGHKGIGKSALFSVAFAEESESGRACLTVRPDDISGIETQDRTLIGPFFDGKRAYTRSYRTSPSEIWEC